MSKEARAQGAEAKKLKLSEFDNPYGPGENHDAWRAGFGVGKDAVEEPNIEGATAPHDDTRQVRKGAAPKKGKKGETADGAKAVVKPTGTGETAVTTVQETAEPREGEGSGAEVTVGDPNASTTAAENDGEGLHLENPDRE